MTRWVALGAIAALGLAIAWRSGTGHRCVHDLESRDWKAAFASCQAEFEATKDLARATYAAEAAYYLQRPHDAVRLATLALSGPTAADAHNWLGSAELALGNYGPAEKHLEVAAQLHAASGNASGESRDDHQRSGVAYRRGDYAAALRFEASARNAATRARDGRMVVFLDIARADILRGIGDLRAAEDEIERALREASEPEDRVVALLKRGELHLDQGHPALARDPLTRALEEERRATLPRVTILKALHLNLAYVERKARAFSRALDEMEQARRAGTDAMSYRLNRGLVYADMGWLAVASADLAAAEAERLDGDWAWWVPFQRAQVAAQLGDTATAIVEDHRAMQQVAKLAGSSGAFGPTVVATHRAPHLHLIGLLAAQQRWDAVLDVVAAMDSQLLLDSKEAASDVAPSPPGPVRPAPREVNPPAPDAVRRAVEAWRSRRLEVVVPGGERLWRIDVDSGKVAGYNVGDAAALADLARQLEGDPDQRDAGSTLGAALLPHSAVEPRIAMLVVGPVARAPLASLRLGGTRVIAHYQLVRAPGLLPRAPVTHGSGPAVVIGDPNGNLPAAAGEAQRVATRLDGIARVGSEATRDAFTRAAGAGLLHIAAHTVQSPDGAAIELADGPIVASAVAALTPAPDVVVLATCGAAVGRDDAGNGSLTTAFLDAGAEVVIGTRWSVADADAARLVDSFYAAGGDRDPVAALATAQLASDTSSRTWAAFEAFVARPTR